MVPNTPFLKLRATIPLILALLSLLLVAGPLGVFAANQSDFSLGFLDIVPPLLPWFFGLFIFLAILGVVAPRPLFPLVTGLLLGVSIGIYLQGFLVNWDYGAFDGKGIRWESFRNRLLVDYLVWGCSLLLGVVLAYRSTLRAVQVGTFLLLLALGNIFGTVFQGTIRWRAEQILPSVAEAFSLSSRRNVVFVLLDAFQSPLFSRLLEREPKYKALFKDFTFFSDATTSFATTTASIPSILSGTTYRNDGTYSDFMKAHLPGKALPEVLTKEGFQSTVVTLPQLCTHLPNTRCVGPGVMANGSVEELSRAEALQLFDVTFFRFAPQPLKEYIYADEAWFLQRLFSRKKIRGIPPTHVDSLTLIDNFRKSSSALLEQPAFLFLHLLIPHAPQRLTSKCDYLSPHVKMPAVERHSRQALCALSLAESVIVRLKELGVYDNSTLVVLADHGSSLAFATEPRPDGFPKVEHAMPILLIKREGEKRDAMAISEAPAMLTDIPKTVVTLLGITAEFSGEDLFTLSPTGARERIYHSYRWMQKYWSRNSLPPLTEFIISGKVSQIKNWKRGAEIPALP